MKSDYDINQFLTLSLLKGQLEEIHHTIEADVLAKMVKRPKEPFLYSVPMKVEFNLGVTNIGDKTEKLVIEELTRLKTFIESLDATIQYMQEKLAVAATAGSAQK